MCVASLGLAGVLRHLHKCTNSHRIVHLKEFCGMSLDFLSTCLGNDSLRRTDAEASILWPPDVKNQLIGKDPDAGKD